MSLDLTSQLQLTVARNLVKYAAGQAMTCPGCDRILDAKSTVYAEDRGRAVLTLCARCWGKCPMIVDSGSVTVFDGRVLWKKAPRRKA